MIGTTVDQDVDCDGVNRTGRWQWPILVLHWAVRCIRLAFSGQLPCVIYINAMEVTHAREISNPSPLLSLFPVSPSPSPVQRLKGRSLGIHPHPPHSKWHCSRDRLSAIRFSMTRVRPSGILMWEIGPVIPFKDPITIPSPSPQPLELPSPLVFQVRRSSTPGRTVVD